MQRTATAILPYSGRARDGAPVAAPIVWEELDGIERASHFTIRDVETLLKRAKSATFSGWGVADQALPALGQVWNSRRG